MVALLEMPSRLKLTPPDNDRRLFDRKEDHRQINAHRLDHSVDALRQPFISLALRDLSVGGASAISDLPLQFGERIALYFSGDKAVAPWTMNGQVLRCEPSGMGYRVGIAFETEPVAA